MLGSIIQNFRKRFKPRLLFSLCFYIVVVLQVRVPRTFQLCQILILIAFCSFVVRKPTLIAPSSKYGFERDSALLYSQDTRSLSDGNSSSGLHGKAVPRGRYPMSRDSIHEIVIVRPFYPLQWKIVSFNHFGPYQVSVQAACVTTDDTHGSCCSLSFNALEADSGVSDVFHHVQESLDEAWWDSLAALTRSAHDVILHVIMVFWIHLKWQIGTYLAPPSSSNIRETQRTLHECAVSSGTDAFQQTTALKERHFDTIYSIKGHFCETPKILILYIVSYNIRDIS